MDEAGAATALRRLAAAGIVASAAFAVHLAHSARADEAAPAGGPSPAAVAAVAAVEPGPAAAEARPKPAPRASLVVRISGGGRPVARAQVQVKGARGETTHLTGAGGEAEFAFDAPATVKVRVLVPGWRSELKDVKLKEGAQELRLELRPLGDAASAANPG